MSGGSQSAVGGLIGKGAKGEVVSRLEWQWPNGLISPSGQVPSSVNHVSAKATRQVKGDWNIAGRMRSVLLET